MSGRKRRAELAGRLAALGETPAPSARLEAEALDAKLNDVLAAIGEQGEQLRLLSQLVNELVTAVDRLIAEPAGTYRAPTGGLGQR